MPWWLITIFPALMICFVIGFLLGLLLMWRRLRDMQTDFERRRLEGEAESDRLRLRISALRERDQQATKLEAELKNVRDRGDKLATLQGQLQEAETKAHLVPALEQQLTETRERALMADRFEEELQVLRTQVQSERSLPSARRASAELPATAEASAAAERQAEHETMSAELRSTRIELEESRSRTGQLDAELKAAREDRDRLRSEVRRTEREESDNQARVAALENEVTSLRAALEQAPTAPAPAPAPLASSSTEPERIEPAVDAVIEPEPVLSTASQPAALAPEDVEPTLPGLSANGRESSPAPVATTAAVDDDSWRDGTTSLGTPGANHDDDLKVINGIGPVMERTLNGFGIRTWEQIAAFTQDDIDKVSAAIKSFPGRIERDDWVGGAKELLAAGHVPGEDTSKRTLTSNRRKRQS